MRPPHRDARPAAKISPVRAGMADPRASSVAVAIVKSAEMKNLE